MGSKLVSCERRLQSGREDGAIKKQKGDKSKRLLDYYYVK
jgi:hypothetical protein